MATVEQSVWDNPELLQQNRVHLIHHLQRKIRGYEAQYELASGQVETELQRGRIRDTADVCDWVIAFRTLRALGG